MGILGKLFKKKECDLCGGEIGLLGNRKLEDGNCCKACAAKLSPWFDDRRHSTVEQIRDQLAYRERNREALESFRVSQVIGDDYKIYIEEVNGIPTRFFVTDAEDYLDENPDIIAFEDVLACTHDLRTHETELTREDANGNDVSYNPPRYEIDYDFYIQMQIANNAYFDDIRFKLNPRSVTLETRGSRGGWSDTEGIPAAARFSDPGEKERYLQYMDMCKQIQEVVQLSRTEPQPAPAAEPCPQPAAAAVQPEPAAPAGPKFCPNCGAPAEGGKFCQSCGSRL